MGMSEGIGMKGTSAVRGAVIGLVGLLLVVAGCGSDSEGDAAGAAQNGGEGTASSKCDGEVNVGIATGLTGPAGPTGEAMLRGFRLGAEDINLDGGLNGRCVEVVAEDTQYDPTLSVKAFHSLVDRSKTPAVLVGGSAAVKATAPLATQRKTLLLNSGGQGGDLAGISPYLFHTIELGPYDVKVISDYMWQQGLRTIATGAVNNETGLPNAKEMQRVWEGLGGTVVKNVTWNQGDVNFGAQAALLKDAAPEAIYLSPSADEAPSVVKQLRESGVTAPLFSYVVVQGESMLETGEAAEGITYTAPAFDAADESAREFAEKFNERFGSEPDSRAALAYDAMLVLKTAYEKAGSFTVDEAAEALRSLDAPIEGTAGALEFGEDGTAVKAVAIKQIKDGEFVTLESAQADG
jgi:branched-chain amino acid transport system substrate-binding protein